MLLACSQGVLPEKEAQERDIMLCSMTKAGGDAQAEQTPVFMFWLDGDQDKLGSETVQPYFISKPSGVVDDYKTTPYNTGYPYPENTLIYANGYCPSTLVADEDSYPFTSLTVPQDMLGYVDITASEGFVQGSADAPFEADADQTMKFEHLLSKVNFKARLGDIPAERYFRGVRIVVAGKDVFTDRIEWGADERYSAASTTALEDVFWSAVDVNTNQMDPNEAYPREIGSVYIHPGQEKIVFDIEVEMSETVTFEFSEFINASATVAFVGPDSRSTLDAGEEYDITITVLYDSFVFVGNKAMWQEGGKIPLPFYPD